MRDTRSVNGGSPRPAGWRPLWFTVVVLGALASASIAHADRVVILRPAGTEGSNASQELIDDIEDALSEAVVDLGHEAVAERPVQGEQPPPPETANEMRGIAEVQGAQWVIVPRVTQASETRYTIFFRVGYAPATRVEELEAPVTIARQNDRLRQILEVMLRAEGMGEDALRLQSEDGTVPAGDDAERRRLEEEQRRLEEEARRSYEERERQRREADARRRREAWESRERYGQRGGPWMLQAGVGIWPLIAHDSTRDGGALWAIELRGGRAIEALPGLEIRAGLDIMSGASSGFALYGGAVLLMTFWKDAPVFLGPQMDIGYHQTLTGNRVPSLMMRASGTAVWRIQEHVFVEASVPEILALTGHGGVVGLGFSLRGGYRF